MTYNTSLIKPSSYSNSLWESDSEGIDETSMVSDSDSEYDCLEDLMYIKNNFIHLQNQYSSLFNPIQSVFLELKTRFAEQVCHVDMDRMGVISTKDFSFIGTQGVFTCHTICAKGHNVANQVFLGLAHVSSLVKPEEALSKLADFMESEGCLEDSIHFYIIGGVLSSKYSCLTDQSEFLSLAEKYRIKEVKFNSIPDNEEYALDIIMSANSIFFGSNIFYQPLDIYTESLCSNSFDDDFSDFGLE